ncbi:hypothetical protein [Pseudomonas juntendi]|uniref:hypothetical protein n=1 Tax=Pseudomonas juntendi TaxID=2666183 RepID=UPI0034556BD3
MIIDVKNKSKQKQGGDTTHSGYNVNGLSKITKWIRYTISPSVVNGVDTHIGVEHSRTNIATAVLHPAIENKLRPFEDAKAYEEHALKYAASQAEFLMEHNAKSRAKTKGQSGKEDLFRFIISCSDKETANLSTHEKVELLHDVGERILKRMSKSKDINFYYRADIHLKDGNPHLHMSVNHFDKDGNYHLFYVGKRYEGGLLDLFQDVKYECEKDYPFLEQMETKLRDQEISEKDKNLVDQLTSIESKFNDVNYNFTKVEQAIKAADIGIKFHRVNGICKDIFLLDNKNPERLVSYKKLPLPMKRLLEKQEFFNIKKSQHKVDLSAYLPFAMNTIRQNSHLNILELNKLLLQNGLKIYPNKSGAGSYSWSLYFIDQNEKLSLQKIGIDTKSEEFKSIFDCDISTINKLIDERIKLKRNDIIISAGSQKVRKSYTDSEYTPYSEFRYDQNETTEQFLNRMKLAHHSKKMLTNQIVQGASVISKFNSKEMFRRIDAHEYELLQSNASSVKTLIQEIVARGDNTIEFTGPSNAKMQEALYIEAMLNGLTVKNYKPTLVVAEKLKDLQEAHFNITLKKNVEKIDAALAAGSEKPTKLVHTRQLDRTIDSKPAYTAMLYALHRAPQPALWAMPKDLKPLTNDDLEAVARRAKADLQIERERLTELFNLACFKLPFSLVPYDTKPDADPEQAQPTQATPAPAKAQQDKPKDEAKQPLKQEVNRNRIRPD